MSKEPKNLNHDAKQVQKNIDFNKNVTAALLFLTLVSFGAVGFGIYQLFWHWEIWFGGKFIVVGVICAFVFGTVAGHTETTALGWARKQKSIDIQQGKRIPGLWARLFNRDSHW